MSNNPTPRNAIVTGAASGLGRAIAVRLACDGWRLALADIDLAGSEETLRQVVAAGGTGRTESLDVSRPDQWIALRDRLATDPDWKHLDLLVNNAGVAGTGEVGIFTLDDWDWLLKITLWGCIYGCHTLVDWLKRNPRGAHIINTGSFAAFASVPAMASYNVAKAGVVSLSETLYAELRPHGVGVTVICPVFFRTNLLVNGRIGEPSHGRAAQRLTDKARFNADDVADAAVRAIHSKRLYVILGGQARWFWRIKRLMPTSFLRVVSKAYQRNAVDKPPS